MYMYQKYIFIKLSRKLVNITYHKTSIMEFIIYIPKRKISKFMKNTVSFHDFKSQNFKSSISNPKNKYAACLSVLSQISNCQGLGRKNKHEILKTDRNVI